MGPIRSGVTAQRQADAELASLSDDALHLNLAAHEADESRDDGQSQARPAEPSRRGGVDLLEGFKDVRESVRGDARPRIRNHEVHDDSPVAGLGRGHGHDDLAHGCELDRIADQVGQDLPQTERVAHDQGSRRRDVTD